MKEVNGCGCSTGLLKYFKPPYAEFFKLCCNAHDVAYDTGGSEENRRHADMWLFNTMITKACDCRFSCVKTTWLTCIALLYYVSVRACGWKYFNYKK